MRLSSCDSPSARCLTIKIGFYVGTRKSRLSLPLNSYSLTGDGWPCAIDTACLSFGQRSSTPSFPQFLPLNRRGPTNADRLSSPLGHRDHRPPRHGRLPRRPLERVHVPAGGAGSAGGDG